MKQSVRKRADRIIMRGVEVMYKKKNSDEVRIIQSREEQMWVLEVWHSDPTPGHFGVKKTFNRVRKKFYWKGMFKDAVIWIIGQDGIYQCTACSQWYHKSCMLSLLLF